MEFHKIFSDIRGKSCDEYEELKDEYDNLPWYKKLYKIEPREPIESCYIECDRLGEDTWDIKDDRYMTILWSIVEYIKKNYGEGEDDIGGLVYHNMSYSERDSEKHKYIRWYRIDIKNFFGYEFDEIMKKLIRDSNGRMKR